MPCKNFVSRWWDEDHQINQQIFIQKIYRQDMKETENQRDTPFHLLSRLPYCSSFMTKWMVIIRHSTHINHDFLLLRWGYSSVAHYVNLIKSINETTWNSHFQLFILYTIIWLYNGMANGNVHHLSPSHKFKSAKMMMMIIMIRMMNTNPATRFLLMHHHHLFSLVLITSMLFFNAMIIHFCSRSANNNNHTRFWWWWWP